MNVTVHHFTKTEKPISVNGKPWGKAVKVNGLWSVRNSAGAEVTRSQSVRDIEFDLTNELLCKSA